MPEQEKKLRRCSFCHFLGHTKRNCLVLRATASDKPRGVPQAKSSAISTSSHSATVFVQSFGQLDPSPHVVDLRKQDTRHVLASVEPFRETKLAALSQRATVDFAVAIHGRKKQHSRFSFPRFRLPVFPSFGRFRFAGVAFLLLLSAIPVFPYYRKVSATNEKIATTSAEGFFALHASTVAAFQSDLEAAKVDLTRALGAFSSAKHIFNTEHPFFFSLLRFVPLVGDDVESGRHLLSAGHHLALGNTYVLKGMTETDASAEDTLLARFDTLSKFMPSIIAEYRSALAELQQIDSRAVPVDQQAAFVEFRSLFTVLFHDLEDVADLLHAIRVAVGGDAFQRYLIVFQNHHERRPTGGFIGSFALVDVQKGRIVNIEIPSGGSYDVKGQLTEYVKPPLPLQLVNGRWEFQDANWFPDFPSSAQKLQWFFEHSRQTTIDGVIAVNATVLERLLRVLGPVDLSLHGVSLDYNTAIATLQKEVEDRHNDEPKAIIGTLFQTLLAASQQISSADALKVLVEAHDALAQKEIQVSMDDASVQEVFREYGWTGAVAETAPTQDYVQVVSANLQGQKSDARIQETIEHQAVIDESGEIIDTVTIRRTHTGTPGEMFYGAQNISYLRVYVPAGAELIEAGGFEFPPESAFHVPEAWYEDDADLKRLETIEAVHAESGTVISREFGKTVFGNWLRTAPGETSVAYLTYRLPFRVAYERAPSDATLWETVLSPASPRQFSRYTLLAQKQSGSSAVFTSRIVYPHGWLPVWKSDNRMDLALNGATFEAPFLSDLVVGVLMEEERE